MLKLLNTNQVLELLDVSQSTLAKMKKDHGFPQPIPLTTRGYRYSMDDINAWLESQKQKQEEKKSEHSELIRELCKPKPVKQKRKMTFEEFDLLHGSNLHETANII